MSYPDSRGVKTQQQFADKIDYINRAIMKWKKVPSNEKHLNNDGKALDNISATTYRSYFCLNFWKKHLKWKMAYNLITLGFIKA